jgi:hypothetical protein
MDSSPSKARKKPDGRKIRALREARNGRRLFLVFCGATESTQYLRVHLSIVYSPLWGILLHPS